MIAGDGAVLVVVEGRELIDVAPHCLIGGVEDVRPIGVHIDAIQTLAVDVPTCVAPALYDKYPLLLFDSLVGEDCAKQSRSDNEIIVLHLPSTMM